ncbi:CoA transferase [Crossiella cryophila]|uniref:Crotonobetainyl-CoA:carnitine CoA-transferase CaiB-like acyl-CoA transferase n=1 Tax=Crossiella cryophila TaxID=43355 RepID=A0A7W7FTC5_9PSEU|nr:CoA transferase [Crossiella cryophila]MBB4676865.1 crotonobetainyl-CoA:carnitine CoA-transferase CaiB-like acyl-CoA transferase [Crossiella cryophila]
MNALQQVWGAIGGRPADLTSVTVTSPDEILPSIFKVTEAATAAVAASTLAAARLWHTRSGPAPEVVVDGRAAVTAFRSERYLRVDGVAPPVWGPLSGDYPTEDGWVRLHCNYPAHYRAVLRALAVPESAVARTLRTSSAVAVEEAVLAAGGVAAAQRSRSQWLASPQARALARVPLVELTSRYDTPRRPLGPAERPLSGVRVLDLTRVIAGPVAGRTLAAHGADVLRVGADHLELVDALVVDTGFGKRFCHLDLRTPEGRDALRTLVRQADVLLQAFRPGALAQLGLGPADCAALNPGLVTVSVSAYGQTGPWSGRRGFDSLVQMATGFTHETATAADSAVPVPLPAQLLDHATGHLAALAAIEGLRRRAQHGGSWHAEVSLARTGAWLDGLGRIDGLGLPPVEVADLLTETDTPFGRVRHVRPAGTIAGQAPYWASPPHRPGADPAAFA